MTAAAPRVSVFLFCKDRAASIRRSVESVLAQTFRDFEYVIQDGASTDGTLEILREYHDPRIDLRSEADAGAADAFWRALRRCRGEYVCACLSDEELLPTALEEAVAALAREPETVAVTRDALRADEHGRVTGIVHGSPFDLRGYLANRFAPIFAATLFRRSALEAAGLHTRDWDRDCGEFELWCRLAQQGPIRYLAGAAAKYSLHDRQLSRIPDNARRLAHGRLRTLDRLAEDAPLLAGAPDLLRASRLATATSFAEHLVSLGAYDAAVDLYLAAGAEAGGRLTPRPDTPPQEYLEVARAQRLAGREPLALAVLEMATQLTQVESSLFCEIARTHAALGRTDRALANYDAAIAVDEGNHDAHWERGLILERRGLIDEALEAWQRSDLLSDRHRHSFYLVATLKSPRSTNDRLLREHRAWAAHHAAAPLPPDAVPPLARWREGEQTVLAFSCSFWDADTITFQLLPLLRRIDRRRFSVIAYADHEPQPLVFDAVDRLSIVRGLSDHEFARLVRRHGVHVLVEINGHSQGHWFAAMAARCAPVQVSYLNYTSTSGVDEVDYIIGDGIAPPPGTEGAFTEAVYRVPGCFFCFTYEGADLPPTGRPPSETTGYPTFGCFGSGGKINPELLDLWARLLHRVPNSRLFIRNGELTPADNRRALTQALTARGIAGERLLILPGTTRRGVLESYGEVDVSLDTYPYCGGNTIAESLWQGVPVVTLKGDRFSSSYGASLLTASGIPELVAESPGDYVEKAAALAQDATRLAFYRAGLRRMVVEFGFSDADRFTVKLEDAFLDMLRRRMAA